MKRERKQFVFVYGRKQFVDVPVDDELYRADRHSEYQRLRSREKDVPLDEDILADLTKNTVENYEKKELFEKLSEALKILTAEERQLIDYIYYHNLTEREIAAILEISQQAVSKQKHKVIKKLRKYFKDWI